MWCTPEGLEFRITREDWKDPYKYHGYYNFETQKIILFPLHEREFSVTYMHELIHALENAYCNLQGVREIVKILQPETPTSRRSILKCVYGLIDLPFKCYAVPNLRGKRKRITIGKSKSFFESEFSSRRLQNSAGNFFYDLIFLEISSHTFEFCAKIGIHVKLYMDLKNSKWNGKQTKSILKKVN